jgi:hypothetical protein
LTAVVEMSNGNFGNLPGDAIMFHREVPDDGFPLSRRRRIVALWGREGQPVPSRDVESLLAVVCHLLVASLGCFGIPSEHLLSEVLLLLPLNDLCLVHHELGERVPANHGFLLECWRSVFQRVNVVVHIELCFDSLAFVAVDVAERVGGPAVRLLLLIL